MTFEFRFFQTHIPTEDVRTIVNHALATVKTGTPDCVYYELYRLGLQPPCDHQNVTISYEIKRVNNCLYDVLTLCGQDSKGHGWHWSHKPVDVSALRQLVRAVDHIDPVSPYTFVYIG